ncbi:MAG: xanthine dehydrogenase small subunit [Bacteroidetes bacterium RIFOXYA12_FULL_35_11]|nr:MAG: xanthine dehydrogenase small subunit [Bacteroidetes bacterium GWF2_35_48]OFY74058.1 MAG: xanthine dehydrogenase small subunit [Bacteroidetes bacterium RIFOXYA12_FULL_35_11]OFY96888.1 MAG: xanthine dehydrogenase small subunit [Bacteroidetes bacterium RIFOXYC12_FULL_35_7]OFY97754.1 MAG: xanthine dehydrogenase small subunit [Bacteroidetes bacterium RIFOXYB2_FULL_35_7]
MDFSNSVYTPTTTVLQYLRSLSGHKGVKEGCAEGDCGACTVVIAENKNGKLEYRAYDSCIIFLPMLHGKQLLTVENLGNSTNLHPVQQAMIETDGSQCGFCTPGFVMSMFAVFKQFKKPTLAEINDALTGNLCRCTGYRPIIEATQRACKLEGKDKFSEEEPEIIKMLECINTKTAISLNTGKQNYFIPFTKAKALSLKAKYPDALVINGATDIALRVTKKKEFLPMLLDLSHIAGLKKIQTKSDAVIFGSGACMEDVRMKSKKIFPALYEMLSVFGSKQIRNKATLGGNIGSASPIGDTPPVLMAYDASVCVENASSSREIKLREFVVSYRTTQLKNDELITSVIIPKLSEGTIVKSYKVSKRKDMDISTVSAGFRLKIESGIVKEIALYYGGMAALTKCAAKAENYLLGKEWTREHVEQTMTLIDEEFTPISDARSGADARKIMARNLLLKFWSETK